MNVNCERIQQAVTNFTTEPGGYFSRDTLQMITEHLRACSPCRSRVEHDLEGAEPEVLAALRG